MATQLAKEGTALVVVTRGEHRLHDLMTSVDVDCLVLVADLSDPTAVEHVAPRVFAMDDPIDLPVNNAGFGVTGNIGDQPVWIPAGNDRRKRVGPSSPVTHRSTSDGRARQWPNFGRVVDNRMAACTHERHLCRCESVRHLVQPVTPLGDERHRRWCRMFATQPDTC